MKNIFKVVRLSSGVRKLMYLAGSVLLLAGFSTHVYADNADFFSEKACNVYMYRHNGTSGADIWLGGNDGYNGTGAAEYNMGTVTQLWLNQWWTKVWKKSGSGDVCTVIMHYRNGGSGTGYSIYGDHYDGKDWDADGSKNQIWGKGVNQSINIISKLCNNVPGDYTMQFWFEANTNQSGTGNCNTKKWLSNNNTNYKVNFKYAGIKSLSASSLKFKQNGESKSITFTTIGDAGDDNPTFAFSGTNSSSFSYSSGSKSGVTITYTGSATETEDAKLIITPAKGLPVTVDLQGSDGNRPVPLIAEEAQVLGNTAELSGYLQYTGCNDNITEYGFYYMTGDGTPTTSNTPAIADQCPTALVQGSEFSTTLQNLTYSPATWYSYRSYAKANDGTIYLSKEVGKFYISSDCPFPQGETVYVTIDNQLSTDRCNLVFNTFDDALSTTEGVFSISNYCSVDGSGNITLKKNIVFEVVESNQEYVGYNDTKEGDVVVSGGDVDASCIKFANINNIDTPLKTLTIRGVGRVDKEKVINKPILEHVVIRNSKNISFEKVKIEGRPEKYGDKYDNAMDIDNGSNDWLAQPVGDVANANIRITDCEIYSQGFTCIHASAYSGIYLENNDIKAEFNNDVTNDDNSLAWGASVKFIHCKNVEVLRNNFRGSHTTTFWLQGCSSMLFMNNVCWNDNEQMYNTAVVRLVSQAGTSEVVEKIGFYYNTMYLAENSAHHSAPRKVDFFRIGTKYTNSRLASGVLDGNTGNYKTSTLAFQYNNCYSYDYNEEVQENCVNGRNTADGSNPPFLSSDESAWCSVVNNNNFWSKYDENKDPKPSSSAFDLGCDNNFINVANLMCHTAPEDPDGLIIVGNGLNRGNKVDSDVSNKGANNMFNDRLHPSNGADAVRRDLSEGDWTLGAYQQTTQPEWSEGSAVGTIVWNGGATDAETDWDNRNNWYKLNGDRLTCLDQLSDTLRVIIPAANSTNYPIKIKGGITSYPEIPASFSREGTEKVNRHSNDMYAKTIYIEYGGALMNAIGLMSGETRYYNQASTHFVAERDTWMLVGTVVKPFDGEGTRNVNSGDFFMNEVPQVYMREAGINDEDAGYWQRTFPELTRSLDPQKVFAILVPNEYGSHKWPAEWYYDDPTEAANAKAAKIPFLSTGYLYNEKAYTTYSGMTVGKASLLCNTYPAALDAKVLENTGWGNVQIYNPTTFSFGQCTTGDVIYPYEGFVFTPNTGYASITMNSDLFVNGSALPKYKSTTLDDPYFTLEVSNLFKAGASRVVVTYDPLKEDEYNIVSDGLKIFNNSNYSVPELYIMEYGKNLSSLKTPDINRTIPLGLRISQPTTVQFKLGKVSDIEKIELVDKFEGKSYDILSGDVCTVVLPATTYEDRFYLNLGLGEDVDPDIPTIVEDSDDADGKIEIFSQGSNVMLVSNSNVTLKEVYITDAVGRTEVRTLNDAHYNVLPINKSAGVYIIKAVGDNMSRTEKVIIK